MQFNDEDHMAKHRWLTGISVCGSVIMLLLFIRRNGFWVDEFYTLHSIRLGWKDMVMERLSRGHVPGYFTLVRLWYALWPESQFEIALRSFSVLFYLLSLGSFWLLARRLLGGGAALVSMALFACNEIALRQAGEARMYTVVLFVAVWIVRACYELQQKSPAARWTIILPILTIVGFSVSASIGLLVGSMLAVNLVYRSQRRLTYTLVLSMVLGLAVYVPGLLIHINTSDRLGMASSKPLVFLAHFTALMPGIQIWDDYYQATRLLMGLLVVGFCITVLSIVILMKQRQHLPPELRRFAWVTLVPLAAIIACYPLIEIFELSLMGPPRYYICLLPLAAILGGWALTQIPKPLWVHGALTGFLLLGAWAILTVRTEPLRHHMARYMVPDYKPRDGVVVTTAQIADGVSLYLPEGNVDIAVDRDEMDRDVIRGQLAPLSDRETVWLVRYRSKRSPILEVAKELWTMDKNYKEPDFSSIRIYRFTPAKGAHPVVP